MENFEREFSRACCRPVRASCAPNWIFNGFEFFQLTALEARHEALRVVAMMVLVQRLAQQVFRLVAHELEHSTIRGEIRMLAIDNV
jgi:hypothetical protein